MGNRRRARNAQDVVAARRFELLDEKGRTRAVLGDASGASQEWFPGLWLLDRRGHARVTIIAAPEGPVVSFSSAAGNVVAEIGVADDGLDALRPGPYVILCRPNGQAAWQVRVGQDGGSLTESS